MFWNATVPSCPALETQERSFSASDNLATPCTTQWRSETSAAC